LVAVRLRFEDVEEASRKLQATIADVCEYLIEIHASESDICLSFWEAWVLARQGPDFQEQGSCSNINVVRFSSIVEDFIYLASVPPLPPCK
jgi:hypothetical protein